MEEASFLSRYASKVYIIHRFDYLEASKVMQRRVLNNPKIEVRQSRRQAAAGWLQRCTLPGWSHYKCQAGIRRLRMQHVIAPSHCQDEAGIAGS